MLKLNRMYAFKIEIAGSEFIVENVNAVIIEAATISLNRLKLARKPVIIALVPIKGITMHYLNDKVWKAILPTTAAFWDARITIKNAEGISPIKVPACKPKRKQSARKQTQKKSTARKASSKKK